MKRTLENSWQRALRGALPLLAIGAIVSCTRDFAPINEVDKFRILAIKAEPQELHSGEQTVFSALIYDLDERPIEYAWSICPLPLTAQTEYNCPVNEEDLKRQLEDAGFPVPGALPISLELGNLETASFTNLLTPEIQEALCGALSSVDLPEGTVPPTALLECGDKLELNVVLDATAGDETIRAFKGFNLLLNPEATANQNPTLDGLELQEGDDPEIVLTQGEEAEVLAERTYQMRAVADISTAETFVAEYADGDTEERRESLFITWNVTGGSTETSRTSFVDQELDFEDLLINDWKTPSVDDATLPLSIFLVLQDERGGVNWITRRVNFGGAP